MKRDRVKKKVFILALILVVSLIGNSYMSVAYPVNAETISDGIDLTGSANTSGSGLIPEQTPTPTTSPDTLTSGGALELDLEALRQLLLDTGLSGEAFVDRILQGFSHDPEFLTLVYGTILEDPLFAVAFMEEMLEKYPDGEVISYIPSDSLDLPLLKSKALFAPRALNGTAPVNDDTVYLEDTDDYITEFFKTVEHSKDTSGNEIFRHYDISLSVTPGEEVTTVGQAVDIAVVFDNAFGNPHVQAVKSAATALGNYIFGNTTGSRIGIVQFSGKGASSTGLANNLSTYNNYVGQIDNGSNSGGNPHLALLTAKNMLGITDSYVYDPAGTGNRKVIIMFTYSNKVDRYSDNWSGTGANASIQIPAAAVDPLSSDGLKRWTYLSGAQTRIGNGTAWNNNDTGNIPVINMEGQYAVSQGVDLFLVNGTGLATLEPMTHKMTFGGSPPPPPLTFFGGTKTQGYAQAMTGATAPTSDRYFPITAINAGLAELYDSIAHEIVTAPSSVSVTDVLAPNFELVSTTAELAAMDITASVTNGVTTLLWEPETLTADTASYVTFRVRVKDQPHWPTGAGIRDGDDDLISDTDRVPANTSTSISYTVDDTPDTKTLQAQPLVTVAPLIAGAAIIADATGTEWATKNTAGTYGMLEGEDAYLKGTITRGNGDYDYQWYKKTPSATVWTPITVTEPVTSPPSGDDYTPTGGSGLGLSVPAGNFPVPDTTAGDYEYLLSIIDNRATAAGYKNVNITNVTAGPLDPSVAADAAKITGSSEGVVQALYPNSLTICEPKLTIKVLNSATDLPTGIPGSFETRVARYQDGTSQTPTSQWYFMGLGIKEYKVPKGTYKAASYVPYGYEVTDAAPASVTIDLTSGSDGWTGFEKEIIIKINSVDAYYFYDWDYSKGGELE